MDTDTIIQLICAIRTIKAPRDICVCAYWFKALVEAHVCLAGREQLKSVDLLPESMEICIELFGRDAEVLYETIHAGATRLIQNCIQQNATAAQLFLRHLDEGLQQAKSRQSVVAYKWILKAIKSLFDESQTSVIGPAFKKVLSELAKLRDQMKCICEEEIDEVENF